VNGVSYDEEMQIITSSGKRVWVRTIGEAVRDETGKIYKVQGAFQDISDRKMAEEKSREKDLQFRNYPLTFRICCISLPETRRDLLCTSSFRRNNKHIRLFSGGCIR